MPVKSVWLLLAVAFAGACQPGRPAAGDVRAVEVNGSRFEMVLIPPGEFWMGSDQGWPDERPVHRVRISRAFWLGRTEVTQGLWRAVMKANPSGFQKGDEYPVEHVSWMDCQEFASRLRRLTGGEFRLPSEAEWEYACRAGLGDGKSTDLDACAWYDANSAASPHAVSLKKANAFGLYDMLGNVWEWCADRYDANYYSRSRFEDPTGPVLGNLRVDRGGCWAHSAGIARPSRRDSGDVDYRTGLLGLRLAATRLR